MPLVLVALRRCRRRSCVSSRQVGGDPTRHELSCGHSTGVMLHPESRGSLGIAKAAENRGRRHVPAVGRELSDPEASERTWLSRLERTRLKLTRRIAMDYPARTEAVRHAAACRMETRMRDAGPRSGTDVLQELLEEAEVVARKVLREMPKGIRSTSTLHVRLSFRRGRSDRTAQADRPERSRSRTNPARLRYRVVGSLCGRERNRRRTSVLAGAR